MDELEQMLGGTLEEMLRSVAESLPVTDRDRRPLELLARQIELVRIGAMPLSKFCDLYELPWPEEETKEHTTRLYPNDVFEIYGPAPVFAYDEQGNAVNDVCWVDPVLGSYGQFVRDAEGKLQIDPENPDMVWQITRFGKLRLEPNDDEKRRREAEAE